MSAVGAPSAAGAAAERTGTRRFSLSHRSILLIVLPVAAVVRLVNLGSQSYWGDELATVRLVRQSLWQMVRHGILSTEETPPLYYVLAAFWSRVFGTSELGLRSFSALVGVATVAVAYAIGVELSSKTAGFMVAAFVALSPLTVWYSQDARAYELLILLTSAALLFFAQALRTHSARSLWLWSFFAAASLTTHYFAIFIIVCEAAALLVIRGTRRAAIRPVGFVGLVCIALLPLFLDQRSKSDHISWITYIGLWPRLKMSLQWFVTGRWVVPFPLLVVLGAAIAATVALRVVSRKAPERELVILAVGAGAIVLPVVISFAGLDYVIDRYLVAAWLPFAAVLATTLASWKRLGAILAVALCVFAFASTVKVATTPALQRSGWRQAARRLAADAPDHTVFVVYPDFEVNALKWYAHDVSVLSAGTVRTRRLVIVAQDPWVSTAANTLRFPVPPSFTQTQKTYFSTFALITYTAPHPVAVRVARLTSMHPTGTFTRTTPWTSSVFRDVPAAARAAG